MARRPCAFAAIASDRSLGRPPALHWLWPAFAFLIRVVAVGHSPVSVSRFSATSLRSYPRALRRHVLATALLRPNQSSHTKHYERDPQLHDRPDLPLARRRHECRAIRGRLSRSSASLEVFVPFNAHWRRSRCPGRPASGRSRFGVSSRPPARATALLSAVPAGADDLTRALAVFRFCGFRAMKLMWRTCSSGAFQPNPSLADRLRSLPRAYAGHVRLAWRRLDGLLLRPYVFDRACR